MKKVTITSILLSFILIILINTLPSKNSFGIGFADIYIFPLLSIIQIALLCFVKKYSITIVFINILILILYLFLAMRRSEKIL